MRKLAFAIVLAAAACRDSSSDSPSDPDASDASNTDGGGAGPADGAAADASADASKCRAPDQLNELEDVPSKRLTIAGDVGSAATADPSIYYPPGGPGGALAYSSVPNTVPGGDQGGIRTRIALSNNLGASWTYVVEVNTPTPIPAPAGLCPANATCTASIVNETPTIVYDPTDPNTDRAWKVFTHRYVVMRVQGDTEAKLLYTTGHIAMFTAKLPAGPWSAPTVVIGWANSGGYEAGALFLGPSRPETTGCAAFGEPGATIAPDGTLHLAVACIHPPFDAATLDIVLLSSPAARTSFDYVSTPLRGTDGACLGGNGKRVNAAHLFVTNGVEYILATPEAERVRAGCFVVPFASPANGELERDADGRIHVVRQLVPKFGAAELVHYAGACTYSPGAPVTGTTMSHLHVEKDKLPELHEMVTGVAAMP